MSITIDTSRPATDHEWDTMWVNCPYATYYHSREWAEIWQTYSNNNIRPKPILIKFSDGKEALLPFSQQNYYYGIIKRYSLTGPPAMALPFYGNWVTNETLSNEHITLITNYITYKYYNIAWRLNPYDTNSAQINVSSKYIQRRQLLTYIIDLTKGEDYILSNMKQSCRNQVKQGIKNNLKVSISNNIVDWKNYYNIYQDTIRRWGKDTIYVLDWKMFEILFYKNNPNIKLWLVWHENNAIGGGICFYSHKKIISWHIASLTEYHKLRPINLLKYMIIKDGIKSNYEWFDFETAGKNVGLQKFKKSFGPAEKMCDVIYQWHPVYYTMKNILR